MIQIPHLKGEKVFGLAKCCIDFPHGANGDSHKLNNVNFSHLWMSSPTTGSNNVQNVPTHPMSFTSHYILPIFSQGGLELKEIIFING
jgi:hypothetical protein